jgi:hypothetical protein
MVPWNVFVREYPAAVGQPIDQEQAKSLKIVLGIVSLSTLFNYTGTNRIKGWTQNLLLSNCKKTHYLVFLNGADNGQTGFVTVYKFAEYMKVFGPFKESIAKMKETVSQEYVI